MNYRVSSTLSKIEVLENANSLLGYQHWYSLPKAIDGSVQGNRIRMVRRGGFFSMVGRGSFDGVVQEIEGKVYIVGQLSSPVLAVGVGATIGLAWALTMIHQGHWANGVVGAATWIIGGYALIRYDHAKIKKLVQVIASSSNHSRQRTR